jgi:hypothetical protein
MVHDTVRQQQIEVERVSAEAGKKGGQLASSLVFLSQLLALCQP